MPRDKESVITINGVTLPEAHSMTVRVAINNFAIELQANGLGEDETGKAIAAGYLACIKDINNVLLES